MRGKLSPTKNIFLQVLWTGVDESAPCLLLTSDHKKYLFNCSEGIQRLFTQLRIKIGKLDTFFFTQHRWSHMGGFPGFTMTLRDAKSALAEERQSNSNKPKPKKKNKKKEGIFHLNLDVHGPEGMKNILDATHSFLRFDQNKVKLNINENSNGFSKDFYKDNEIVIHSLPIFGSVPLSNIGGSFPKSRLIEPLNPNLVRSPPSVCYACHLNPYPGKFLPEKAIELGVPKGPNFSKLNSGETIVLPDGKEVFPHQVKEKDIPGVKILIIDCPTESYIKSLSENKYLQPYMTTESHAELIVHLTNEKVSKTKDYIKWTKRFPDTTKQIFLHKLSPKKSCFEDQRNLQEILNLLDGELFPLIDRNIPTNVELEERETLHNFSMLYLRNLTSNSPQCYDHELCMSRHCAYSILDRAKEILSKSSNNSLNAKGNDNTDKTIGGTLSDNIESGKRLSEEKCFHSNAPDRKRSKLDPELASSSQSTEKFPKVVCLGTGAAIPSKYRNVSSTLLLLRKDTAVLFDCGEDTYGQLYRHYGDKTNDVLKKIKLILVSHMHADHHMGLFTLVRKIDELKESTDPDVILAGPDWLRDWFFNYGKVGELLKCQFIASHNLYPPNIKLYKDITVQSVKVQHPAAAHGYVVSDGRFKFVFSGDTMPCKNLIAAGQKCTLLIHEATLEDDLIEEALARKHSTTAQALEVGQQMNAKNVLLTHFSQRYPKIPALRRDIPIVNNTAIAVDHMELTLDRIHSFVHLIPKMSKLFKIPEEDDRRNESLAH